VGHKPSAGSRRTVAHQPARKLAANLLATCFLVTSLLSICLLAGCAPGATDVPVPTPTPLPTAIVPEKPTYTVQRGTVVDSLTFTGRVSPVKEEELYFRTDGRVLAVYAERGGAVQDGDLLAELDVAALYRELERAELTLETAKIELASAEAERVYDLDRAELNLEQAQIALDKLRNYDSRLDLAVVAAELEKATVALQKAQSQYDAVAHVPNIAMRPEAEALQEATLAHARAQAAYDQAVRQADQRIYDLQTEQKKVEQARLEVERLQAGADPRLAQAVAKAELELDDLQAQITDTLILAPFDGKVTAVSTAAGKAVEGFKPVFVVADPSELEVTAELSADEMRELSEGQEATVIPVEYPGQELPGTIESLPYPYGSGGSATGLEDEDRTTHVKADFRELEPAPSGAGGVEPGDLVRVTVVLERKEDVLWLPPAAIRTYEGREFVVVLEGTGQRRVDVTLGIESDDRVEMVDGLVEGQVVVGP
jgi:RND family efflux transporter MFP subunit